MDDAARDGILALLEPRVESRDDGRVHVTFHVKPEFTIPPGIVQGGIVAAMLDMAMAFAAGGSISTAAMQFEVLRPVTGPELSVVGSVAKRGRRLLFADAEMRDASGTLLARGRQTAIANP